MTVMATDNYKKFSGLGSPGPFTWPWRFLDNDDVRVYHVIGGVRTILSEGEDYTLTGAGSYTGGTLILSFNLELGEELIVVRYTEALQPVSIRNQGNNFRPEVHEDVFDRLTLIAQDRASLIERTLLVPEGESSEIIDATEYDNRAGKVLGFNSLGKLALMAMNFVTSSGVLGNPWADLRGYDSLADAVASIGGTSIDLVVYGHHVVADHLTVPKNIRLVPKNGGTIEVAAGKTLSVHGPLDAGPYPVFSGSGTVVGLSSPMFEHFGAVGDGVTNDTAAISKALVAAGGSRILGNNKTYLLDKVTYSGDVDIAYANFISNTDTDTVFDLNGENIRFTDVTATSNFSGTGDIANASYAFFRADRGLAAGAFTANSSCLFVDCEIVDYQNCGIYAEGYDKFSARYCTLRNLGAEGVNSWGCNNVAFVGNTVNQVCGGALQTGAGAPNTVRDKLIIANNTIEDVFPANATPQADTNDHGIAVEVNSVFETSRIIGNKILKAHSMGISLSSASKTVVNGNILDKIGLTSRSSGYNYQGYASIEVVNADWCTVADNKIIDPYQTGVVIDKSHNCKFSNHFINTQGVTRSASQFFYQIKGTGNDALNSSWGNTLSDNIFDNGGENNAGQADSKCYAVYNILNGYGYYSNYTQKFSDNTVIDCIVHLAGKWDICDNTIRSNGILDGTASTAWGLPLLYLVDVTAPIIIRGGSYTNHHATKTRGFAQVSSAQINNFEVHGVSIENTDYVLYASGGFVGKLVAVGCHFKTITAFCARGKNGTAYYIHSTDNTGDRLADMPMIVYGADTSGVTSPIAGDIVFKINPAASQSMGWQYTAAGAWKAMPNLAA